MPNDNGSAPVAPPLHSLGPSAHWPAPQDEVQYIEAISQGLFHAMEEDPSVFVMGQDVSAYGGAFKITRGFKPHFGGERIFNTPIAESGTMGMACGAALLGQRPVIEMQFADFISCGFNQTINMAAKMYWRTERPVPLVIRLPSGGGVGAGAFHSQNLEAIFAHTPGLKIVTPAFPRDAYTMIVEAIRDPNPVLYFEHKYLYRHSKEVVPAGVRQGCKDRVVGRSDVVRPGTDVTVVAYSWMVHLCLEAAEALEEEGISVEVIDLRVLCPLDDVPVIESARKTGRVVVVHEATRTCGFGAEVVARVAEHAMDHLDGPIRRVAYPDMPVPFHRGLDDAALPSVEKITAEIRDLHRW